METRSAAPGRHVAFLRAINVGGHTVKMDHLRTLFDALGFSGVETFIASGNVIFESPEADVRALEARIEGHLRQALGYAVDTFIRSPAEVKAIADHPAFPDPPDVQALSIAFLKAPPAEEAIAKLMGFRSEIDDFHVHQREVYWQRRTRISESVFSGAVLEKALGMPATLRNVTTVRKLGDRYASPR